MKFPPWWGYGYFLELHNMEVDYSTVQKVCKHFCLHFSRQHLLCISLKKSLDKILCSVGDVLKILLWKI